MTCYHPLKGFVVGTNPDTNKKILKITPYEIAYISKNKNNDKYHYTPVESCPFKDKCQSKNCTPSECECFEHDPDPDYDYFFDFVPIPCGKCIGCRIDKARQWASRLMLEKEYSTDTWFITLTYDNDHLVAGSEPVKVPTGRTYKNGKPVMIKQFPNVAHSGHMTLNKQDYVNFNKRLRKKFGEGVRFFIAGEYGEKNNRPHLHGIYFNLPLDDLEVFKTVHGVPYYTSKTISELWPFGFHLIGKVSYDTCAYVSRYVTKKLHDVDVDKYREEGIEREFCAMSRNPGIASQWFNDHHEKLDSKSYIITVSTSNGAVQFSSPKYFDHLIEALDGVRLADIKENRKYKAQKHVDLLLSKTDKDYLDMLADEEYKFKHDPKNVEKLNRERFRNVSSL